MPQQLPFAINDADNHFVEFPPELSKFVSLEVLSFARNRLQALPADVWKRFTPAEISTSRCYARVWAGGRGGSAAAASRHAAASGSAQVSRSARHSSLVRSATACKHCTHDATHAGCARLAWLRRPRPPRRKGERH